MKLKDIAKGIVGRARDEGLRLHRDDAEAIKIVGPYVLRAKRDDGTVDEDLVIKELGEALGFHPNKGKTVNEESATGEASVEAEETAAAPKKSPKQPEKRRRTKAETKSKQESVEKGASEKVTSTKKSPATKSKKRKAEVVDVDSNDQEEAASPSPKKAKGKIEVACTENEEMALCFHEIGKFKFKEKDSMKGAAFMKAYRAIAECPEAITTAKQAMKLKGVGKKSGELVDEYLSSGKMEYVEMIRNGEV